MVRRKPSSEQTGFEAHTLEDLVANYLYTSEGMFGEIVFDAERELFKRITPPQWAEKHPLPHTAREFWDNGIADRDK